MVSREDNLSAVKRYFAAVATADPNQMLEPCTDDLVYVERFSNPPRRIEGKETIHAYFAKAAEIYRMSLEITEVHESLDPDEIILEYKSNGRVLTTGDTYANEYIGIYRFRDGQIRHIQEFHNAGITGETRLKE